MKRVLTVIGAVVFAALLIPLIIVSLLSGTNSASSVRVYIAAEDKVEEMEVNEYLKRVVAAEMPVDFGDEALKAQAVAARTYLEAHLRAEPPAEHKGAPVCADSTHCQAYISREKRFESWGEDAEKKWDKISDAVESTDGLIMTCGGEVISAVFHSTSSGRTERAADVWGEDVPYLQSVVSEGDMYSPKYTSEVRMSTDEFKKTASDNIEGTDWSGALYGNIVRSDAGGIITLDVGGVNIRGTEFRRIFNLNSTNTELSENNGELIISVKGFGHGVGMSQYGANYLAEQGKDYEEILKTYYTGIEIEKKKY